MHVNNICILLSPIVIVSTFALKDLSYESLMNLGQRDVYSDCLNVDFSETCKKGPADCFAAMCNACRNVVIISECCGLATDSAKLVCLNNAMANPQAWTLTRSETMMSTSRPSSIATTPIGSTPAMTSIAAVSGIAACADVLATRQSCQSQTSQFAMLPFNNQAQCLCFNKNKVLNASAYDGPWSTCLAYASATSPALYSSLTQTWGAERAPCSKIGSANNTSIFASSSVWYIGYTIDPVAKPTAPSSGQSSAIPLMTAAASVSSKPNGSHRNGLDLPWLLLACFVTTVL